jgi:hypothetical protein
MSRTLRQKKIFSKRAPSLVEKDVSEDNRILETNEKGGCNFGGRCSDSTPIRNSCVSSFVDNTGPPGNNASLCVGDPLLTRQSVDVINGTCGVFNPAFFNYGRPGSRWNPIGRNIFFLEYVRGAASPWAFRLITTPMGLTESFGIGIAVNNVAGRTIAMIKGECYFFNVAPLEASGLFACREGPLLQSQTAIRFTYEPGSGGVNNAINSAIFDSQNESKGILPDSVAGLPVMLENNVYKVVLGSNVPFIFFYGSVFATFMGGTVVALGCCPDDYAQFAMVDSLPACGY